MKNPRITYLPHSDATPESELRVLTNVYAYLIKNHHSKKAAKTRPTLNWRGKAFDTKEGG